MMRYIVISVLFSHSDSCGLKCSDPKQSKLDVFVKVDEECDFHCFIQGRVEVIMQLACALTPYHYPNNCTLQNANGITAKQLVDASDNIKGGISFLVINANLLNNPVDFPVSPNLQGVWTCTCRTKEGANLTGFARVAACCELYS